MKKFTDTTTEESENKIRELLLKASKVIEYKELLQMAQEDLRRISGEVTSSDGYSTNRLKLTRSLQYSTADFNSDKALILKYFKENPTEVVGRELVSNSGICFSDESPIVSRKKAKEYLYKDFIPVEISHKAFKATLGLITTWVSSGTFLNRLSEVYPAYFAIHSSGHLVYMGPIQVLGSN